MPGAIEDFDLVRFGGPTIPQEFPVTIGVASTQIVPNDPDRLSVTVTNLGANPLYWSINPALSTASAQLLGVGQTFVFQVQNDGALCGVALYGMMPVGAGPVNVLLLRRQHKAA